jgi:hypothetical protein
MSSQSSGGSLRRWTLVVGIDIMVHETFILPFITETNDRTDGRDIEGDPSPEQKRRVNMNIAARQTTRAAFWWIEFIGPNDDDST